MSLPKHEYLPNMTSIDDKVLHDIDPTIQSFDSIMISSVARQNDHKYNTREHKPRDDIPSRQNLIYNKRHNTNCVTTLSETRGIERHRAEAMIKVTTQQGI